MRRQPVRMLEIRLQMVVGRRGVSPLLHCHSLRSEDQRRRSWNRHEMQGEIPLKWTHRSQIQDEKPVGIQAPLRAVAVAVAAFQRW